MLIINNMVVNRNTDDERVNSEDQHTEGLSMMENLCTCYHCIQYSQ